MQISLTPDFSLLVILAIFLANYFVLRTFLFKPVNDVLLWREHEVRDADRIYEDSLTHFHNATSEMESKIHEAKKRGTDLREQRRGEAMEHRSLLVGRSRSEAEELVRGAEEQLASDVVTAKEQIVSQSDSLARIAASRIAGRSL